MNGDGKGTINLQLMKRRDCIQFSVYRIGKAESHSSIDVYIEWSRSYNIVFSSPWLT